MAGYETCINEDWTKEESFKLYSYWDFIEPLALAVRERSLIAGNDWWIFGKDSENNIITPIKMYQKDISETMEEIHTQISTLIPLYFDFSDNSGYLDGKACNGLKNWTESEILAYIGDTERETYQLNKLDNIVNIKWIIQSRKILNALKYIVYADSLGTGDLVNYIVLEKYSFSSEESSLIQKGYEYWTDMGGLATVTTNPDGEPKKFNKLFDKIIQAFWAGGTAINEQSLDFFTEVKFEHKPYTEVNDFIGATEYIFYWLRKVSLSSKWGKVEISINVSDIAQIDKNYIVYRCDCENNKLERIDYGTWESGDDSFIIEIPKRAPKTTSPSGDMPHEYFQPGNPYNPNGSDIEKSNWNNYPKTEQRIETYKDEYTLETLNGTTCNNGIVILLKPDFQFV